MKLNFWSSTTYQSGSDTRTIRESAQTWLGSAELFPCLAGELLLSYSWVKICALRNFALLIPVDQAARLELGIPKLLTGRQELPVGQLLLGLCEDFYSPLHI